MKRSDGLELGQDDKEGNCYLYIVHGCAVTTVSIVFQVLTVFVCHVCLFSHYLFCGMV